MRLIDADMLPRRRYPEYDETGEFIDVMCVKAEDIDNAPTVAANMSQWIPVTPETMPESGVTVLPCCERRYRGKSLLYRYICDGQYIAKHTETVGYIADDIATEYDEETDEFYLPEGFYERINNWDEYSSVVISDSVTHWMPMPEPPKPH